MSESNRSGAHILALAQAHNVITADELPEVLASIEEARNGPASGPWCENCGDAFDGPERNCPQPAPGEPLKQCGRGGHMFRLERASEGKIASFMCLPDDWGGSEKPNKETRDLAISLVRRLVNCGHHPEHIAPMADGGIGLHYLRGDRAARFDVYNDEGGIVVVTREPGDDKSRYLETKDDYAVEEMRRFLSTEARLRADVTKLEVERDEWRRLAGERADAIAKLKGEMERLRGEHGRLDHELVELRETAREDCEALKEIAAEIDRHLPETDDVEAHGCDWLGRIASAGAVIDATARDRDEWRRKHTLAEAACAELETVLAIKRTDSAEPLAGRLWRVYTFVMEQRARERKMERSRDHWKAKAKRLSEGARRGVVGSGGAAASFAVGDIVTWSSSAGGGTKRKRGKVVEVVAPGKRTTRGYGYGSSRKHTWYVVDVDGEIYYPRAAGLRRAKGGR